MWVERYSAIIIERSVKIVGYLTKVVGKVDYKAFEKIDYRVY